MRIRAPHLAALALTGAAAVGLTACGSSGSGYAAAPATTAAAATTEPTASGAGAGASTVTLTADPNGGLSFDTTHLTARAGAVTVRMDNPASSGVPHGIAVEGNGVNQDGPTVQPGGVSVDTLTLKPGTYRFYCPVPGHEAAGMKGTLVVS